MWCWLAALRHSCAVGVEVGQHLGSPGAQGSSEPGDLGHRAGPERVDDLLGDPAAYEMCGTCSGSAATPAPAVAE